MKDIIINGHAFSPIEEMLRRDVTNEGRTHAILMCDDGVFIGKEHSELIFDNLNIDYQDMDILRLERDKKIVCLDLYEYDGQKFLLTQHQETLEDNYEDVKQLADEMVAVLGTFYYAEGSKGDELILKDDIVKWNSRFLRDDLTDNYVNEKDCSLCKGKFCCQHTACAISPSDLKEVTYENIKGLIDSGIATIDSYDGDPENEYSKKVLFYLRVRDEGSLPAEVNIAEHGCRLLSDTGCTLPVRRRPKGARKIKPNYNNGRPMCLDEYDKTQCVIEWKKYKEILLRLWVEYGAPIGDKYVEYLHGRLRQLAYLQQTKALAKAVDMFK